MRHSGCMQFFSMICPSNILYDMKCPNFEFDLDVVNLHKDYTEKKVMCTQGFSLICPHDQLFGIK